MQLEMLSGGEEKLLYPSIIVAKYCANCLHSKQQCYNMSISFLIIMYGRLTIKEKITQHKLTTISVHNVQILWLSILVNCVYSWRNPQSTYKQGSLHCNKFMFIMYNI